MDLKTQTLQMILKNNLLQSGDTVVVGVSGGADSVCLLYILSQLRLRLGIQLHAAHYNHQLRSTANRDEAFVRSLAKQLNVPLTVERRKAALKTVLMSEDKARHWRFRFFAKTAQTQKAQSIALAHHQNDLAETVLMRLLRGSGLLGLRGILAENYVVKQRFIRPFLGFTRLEIEAYLKKNKLKFCQDETNQQTHYLRNKIRLKLLPQLVKEYNPNLSSVLVDIAYTSQADYDYLLTQAQGVFKAAAICSKKKVSFKLKVFLKQHVSIQRMLLRLSYEELVSHVTQLSLVHVQEVEDLLLNRPMGSVVHWPKAVTVIKSEDKVVLTLL